MSAKNRKQPSVKLDQYPTPVETVKLISQIEEIEPFKQKLWFEPCCGEGSFIKHTHGLFGIDQNPIWSACELDSKYYEPLDSLYENGLLKEFTIGNFLDNNVIRPEWYKFDVICTNPPFSLAEEFFFKSRKMAKTVIMLLRAGFLSSLKRSWLDDDMPNVYQIPYRPKFLTGINPLNNKPYTADSCDYIFAVWNLKPQKVGEIRRLKVDNK